MMAASHDEQRPTGFVDAGKRCAAISRGVLADQTYDFAGLEVPVGSAQHARGALSSPPSVSVVVGES